MPAKKTPQTQAPTKRKTTAIKDKLTKTQILNEIAQHTDLSHKQVAAVFDELGILIERSIKKRALGEFTLPGLLKIVTVKKPARKAYKGINPLTGEEHMFKSRPASTAVKVRPLKKLKDFAAS